MKKRFFRISLITAVALALVLSLGVAAYAAGPSAGKAFRGTNGGAGTGTGVVATPLTADEAASLTLMTEEEKLARDVYQYFYTEWELAAFANIAASEQTHMDAVHNLLVRYSLTDPAAGEAAGVFTDPDLQALYDQLIEQGSQSLAAALEVGIVIEETDIADLQDGLAAVVHTDISRVYTNLLNGSYNHLRAFNTELALLDAAE